MRLISASRVCVPDVRIRSAPVSAYAAATLCSSAVTNASNAQSSPANAQGLEVLCDAVVRGNKAARQSYRAAKAADTNLLAPTRPRVSGSHETHNDRMRTQDISLESP
jgi:hypothetical protein